MIEYRICWAASSDASFRGKGDWTEANEGETPDEIEESLTKSRAGGICDGLEMALEFSGFEWWVETRVGSEAESSRGTGRP